MSRLESARARLEGAINRLEEVLCAGQAAAGDDPAAMQRQLAATRADHAALSSVTNEVIEQLDQTIERLETVLGEQ